MATLNLKLSINIWRDGTTKQYVVYSPMLDLSSYGKTEQQALLSFQESTQLFISDLIKRNVLDDVLTELGWQKAQHTNFGWIPPHILHQKMYPVRVEANA